MLLDLRSLVEGEAGTAYITGVAGHAHVGVIIATVAVEEGSWIPSRRKRRPLRIPAFATIIGVVAHALVGIIHAIGGAVIILRSVVARAVAGSIMAIGAAGSKIFSIRSKVSTTTIVARAGANATVVSITVHASVGTLQATGVDRIAEVNQLAILLDEAA